VVIGAVHVGLQQRSAAHCGLRMACICSLRAASKPIRTAFLVILMVQPCSMSDPCSWCAFATASSEDGGAAIGDGLGSSDSASELPAWTADAVPSQQASARVAGKLVTLPHGQPWSGGTGTGGGGGSSHETVASLRAR